MRSWLRAEDGRGLFSWDSVDCPASFSPCGGFALARGCSGVASSWPSRYWPLIGWSLSVHGLALAPPCSHRCRPRHLTLPAPCPPAAPTDACQLITRTRQDASPCNLSGFSFESFENTLRFQARARIPARLWGKIPPCDLVQETLAKAILARRQFRGTTPAEAREWLITILRNTLSDMLRSRHLDHVSLDAGGDGSCLGILNLLGAPKTSVGSRLAREEEIERMVNAIERLPRYQRDALILHYWQDLKILEIARHLSKTEPAVTGLLRRGLKRLRVDLGAS